MKIIVTGAAGFIGSNLCGRLLADGHTVIGIDSFNDFYPRWIKEKNLGSLCESRRFRLISADLNDIPLSRLLRRGEAVFHLAAQAGVRSSWGPNFAAYLENNVQATQKLLEAAKTAPLRKFVFASSSSVYGLTPDLPMSETSLLRPLSPYGVTKLAAENLCFLYSRNHGVPAVSLRFFTVYGPGQRPDMAFHRFFKAVLDGREIIVFGDGKQTRDFTFVDDIVQASVAALDKGQPGRVYNIGGGHRESLDRLFPVIEDICGGPVKIRRADPQKGDVLHTFADIRRAGDELGYEPGTSLRDGLRREWDWVRGLYAGARSRGRSKGKKT